MGDAVRGANRSLTAVVAQAAAAKPLGEGSEYHIYPPNLTEPYTQRRWQCGAALYKAAGVQRDDKRGRFAELARNFDFFGAPVGLFFTIDRQMQQGQFVDLGIFLQSIMLLARERGLHTCAQEAWALRYKTVGQLLAIPKNHMLFCGMALGYSDMCSPGAVAVNTLVQSRASVQDFASFYSQPFAEATAGSDVESSSTNNIKPKL
mmetsp:Transcript_27999/g.55109  ORF Transcript_27999/g.55109 Transcript_27999/m.55109 type:complete len:205 (+) Transcript_27999:184-798(+)